MKVTKRKIWVLAILACAQIVAFTLYLTLFRRSGNEVVVHVVNSVNNRPSSNVTVRVYVLYNTPVISSFHWLPKSLRQRVATNSFKVLDGTFRIPRISRSSSLSLVMLRLHGEGYSREVIYDRTGFRRGVGFPPGRGVRPIPTEVWTRDGVILEMKDGSITILIDPNWY